MKTTLTDRIKLIRKTFHLSQKDFGAKLGVSRDVISNIEYGRVAPKDIMLHHICEVFGINEVWLRTGKGNMQELITAEQLETALQTIKTLDKDFYNIVVEIAKLKEYQPAIYSILQQTLHSIKDRFLSNEDSENN